MARSFNGAGDAVVAASATPTNFEYTNTFSVHGWIYITATGVIQPVISTLSAAAGNPGWEIRINASQHPEIYLISNVGASKYIEIARAASSFSTLTWYSYGFSYNGNGSSSGLLMYINGVFLTPDFQIDLLAGNSIVSNIAPNIGRIPGAPTTLFAGRISDVSVWNVVLTAEEFSALAKGRRPYMVRQKSLVSYWPLDGLQSPEPDLSGNANNGTLTGTAFANGPPVTMFTPRWPNNDFTTSAPSFVPAWAAQSNLPVIGAGTY